MIDTNDMTGQLPSLNDVQEARAVVRKHMVNMSFMIENPEIGVQLPNIDRLLAVAESVISEVAKKAAKKTD
jgi:hypothetical protein